MKDRAEKVRRLLERAREACGRDIGNRSYWAEMALTIGVLEHVHNLVTDEDGEHVTVRVPPMLGAFMLNESHYALHASMLDAVAAVRKFSAPGVDDAAINDISAAAEE